MGATKAKKGGSGKAYDGSLDGKRKECPKCGKRGTVGKRFGIRFMGDTFRAQSWCNECRNEGKKEARNYVQMEVEVVDDDVDATINALI